MCGWFVDWHRLSRLIQSRWSYVMASNVYCTRPRHQRYVVFRTTQPKTTFVGSVFTIAIMNSEEAWCFCTNKTRLHVKDSTDFANVWLPTHASHHRLLVLLLTNSIQETMNDCFVDYLINMEQIWRIQIVTGNCGSFSSSGTCKTMASSAS